MLRIYFLIVILLLACLGFGQVDPLMKMAQGTDNDSLQLSHWHEAAQRMHSDSALILLHHVRNKSLAINHRYWQAKVYQTLAKKCAQINGDIDSLFIYSEQSKTIFEELNLPVEIGRSIMQMGMSKMNQGEREQAMTYLTESARIFEQEGATSVLAPVYINISSIFNQSEDRESEIKYLSKAYHIARQSHDLRNEAIACMGIQNYFGSLDEIDSASYYAIRAFDIGNQMKDPILIQYATLNLGKLELRKGRNEIAESYYLKLLDGPASGHDRARMLNYVACFYFDTGNFSKADTYFQEASQLAASLGANDLHLNIQSVWTEALYKLRKYKQSAEVAHQYMVMSDSLHSTEVRTNLNELTIKYETEKKERENQALLAANRLNELEIFRLHARVNRQILMVIISLLGLCLALLFYYLNKKNQNQKNEIASQHAALQDQKIKELETEQILSSIKSLVRGQEEERSRIAKELHDGLGSLISSLKLSLSQLPDYGERLDYRQQIHNTITLADKANSELRRIAQNLMPETLTRFGLIAALEDFIAEINFSKAIHIQFQYFYTEQELPDELALSIYRIIQELLNNAMKHARASEVFVQLMKHGNVINITVEDDGLGFDPDKMKPGNGFENIESRLAYFGGNLRIESQVGEGTSIFIECPIERVKQVADGLSK